MFCMTRDIRAYFAKWAATYDQTIRSPEGIFAEVFESYEEILDEVVRRVKTADATVADVGSGTGNLSLKCLQSGHKVISIDPSPEMRAEAAAKLPPDIAIRGGDFLALPLPDESVDAVVSTWAFHHVPDNLKPDAVREIARVLRPGGKVVMADTAYESKRARVGIHERLIREHKLDWLGELQAEYYPTLPEITEAFHRLGWVVTFTRMNRWVWLWEAEQNAVQT